MWLTCYWRVCHVTLINVLDSSMAMAKNNAWDQFNLAAPQLVIQAARQAGDKIRRFESIRCEGTNRHAWIVSQRRAWNNNQFKWCLSFLYECSSYSRFHVKHWKILKDENYTTIPNTSASEVKTSCQNPAYPLSLPHKMTPRVTRDKLHGIVDGLK